MGSAEQTEMRLQRLAHRTGHLHRTQTATCQLHKRLSKTFATICHGRTQDLGFGCSRFYSSCHALD